MISVRRAGPLDTSQMAELLNQIIEAGGTTALTQPVTRADMELRMARAPTRSVWHVAEDSSGTLVGFQWIAPHPDLGPEAADIASFVRIGTTGLGTGTALFEATKIRARELGYRWINATIRSDNAGGLAYYQSRGFETWTQAKNVPLANGQIVDKISKRYNLD